MKKDSGITMITLVTTIVVLLILSSITVRLSVSTYETVKVQNFVSKLKVIQGKVDNIAQEYDNLDELQFTKLSSLDDNNEDKQLFKKILEGLYGNSDNIDDYYYFTPSDLQDKLDLQDLDMTVIINFKTREVITKNYVKEDGVEKYRQYDVEAGGDTIIKK